MIQKVKNLLMRTLLRGLSTIKSQNFWKTLYLLALKQMNFGNGGNFSQSGELFVLKLIQKKLEKEPEIVIFDVGANVGNYSKIARELFNANKTKIFAFEPSKKTFELLVKNTLAFENIIPIHLGLSSAAHTQLLFSNKDASELASVYPRKLNHFGIQMDKSEEIQLTTIDNFCNQHNITHIHFLKLDIEGHEMAALKGAKEMIANKKIDFIQFEFGGCNIDSKTYFQDFYYLLKDDYQIYRVLQDDIYELSVYEETLEVFITSNYFAIKKIIYLCIQPFLYSITL